VEFFKGVRQSRPYCGDNLAFSGYSKVRQQLMGEKAGTAKCDEITWTEKRSIKATPENCASSLLVFCVVLSQDIPWQ